MNLPNDIRLKIEKSPDKEDILLLFRSWVSALKHVGQKMIEILKVLWTNSSFSFS